MGNLFESLKSFLKQPFAQPMSMWQYAALVGVTIVIVILWNFVILEIARGVKEV